MAVETRCSLRRSRIRDRRGRVVSVRLSDAELDDILAAAEQSRLALGAYVANAAVTQARDSCVRESADLRALHAELSQAWTSISRVGTNVNQLAKVANSTGEVDHARLGPTLAYVRRSLLRVEETCLRIAGRLS